MPEVIATSDFARDLADLPDQIRSRVQAKLALLAENPGHPSLRAKRLRRHAGFWEMSVTMKYRVIFEYSGNVIRLWAIGPHSILDRP